MNRPLTRISRRWLQAIGAVGAALAVLPIVVGVKGGIWPVCHVTGGVLALFSLVVSGLRLPVRERAIAGIGFVISLIVISIVTGGGNLGTIVQVGVLVVLGAIFLVVVFGPQDGFSRRTE